MGDLEKVSGRELDPLLKNLQEKKHNFRRMARDFISLAAELKEARSKMASQEESFARETQTRQMAETRARDMEEEVHRLQRSLEERNEQLKASTLGAELYLMELENLRAELSTMQAIADASAASAESTKLQFLDLLKELDDKSNYLRENQNKVDKLGEQLDYLQRVLQERDASQKQLRDEATRIGEEIKHAVLNSGVEFPAKNLRNIVEHVNAQNEEIAKLRDEIRMMSAHWKLKTQEMESLLDKHQRADQELKKRVLKLEFCLQEARSQTRKLQRMEERRDKVLKELEQLVLNGRASGGVYKQNFWETSGFKIIVSMTMLGLVVFAKR